MKYAHIIEMRVFCKEEEDEQKVVGKIKEIFPFDFEKEKVEFSSKTAFGFDDKKIKIFAVKLDRERHISKFLKHFVENMSSEQKELLIRQLESRLDDHLHFYIRLDKDALLNGEYWITDSGNCFHFTIVVAAYPHTREAAKLIIKKLFMQNN